MSDEQQQQHERVTTTTQSNIHKIAQCSRGPILRRCNADVPPGRDIWWP